MVGLNRVWLSLGLVVSLTAALLVGSPSPAGAVAGYGDVGEGIWYTDAVQWSTDKEIADIGGFCFGPDTPVSRGETAVWIHNMENRPDAGDPHSFTDVTDASQNDAISWMSNTGITTGTPATTFAPGETLRRAQVAAFLHRLAGEPPAPPHSFSDVVAGWQQDPVSWMSNTGITTGTSATTFAPEDTLTRAHLVTFLYRYSGEPDVTLNTSTPNCEPGEGVHNIPDSPPDHARPTWVFAGQVSQTEQNKLQEEMDYSQAYFADQFGVTATGFTILVGENYEALAPVYRDVVGADLSDFYHPEAQFTFAWVTRSAEGGAVITLMYGADRYSFESLEHHIAHEYFHVLQGQLASGFAQLQNGEIGWHTNAPSAPEWLVEGLASYADYKYTPSRSGRASFLDRYSPFKDLGWSAINEPIRSDDLATSINSANVICSFGEFYFYALSFVAALFLAELSPGQAEGDSYVNFWKLLGERSTWQEAFEEAFGIGINEFYDAFEEWLPTQIPSYDQVTIEILWPNVEAHPQVRGEFLYVIPHLDGNSNHILWSAGSRGFWQPTLYLTLTYPAGVTGIADSISLWWSDDQITTYLLGWYKDGELTDQSAEATPIQLSGTYDLKWTLPAHPNTLPRLRQGPRGSETDP